MVVVSCLGKSTVECVTFWPTYPPTTNNEVAKTPEYTDERIDNLKQSSHNHSMVIWENVTKTFDSDLLTKPVTALDDVSFELVEGSTTGFLGANGAGKTTSIKIALGFTSATRGEARFSSRIGKTRDEALRRTGFLPERPYFYPHLTGHEFALYMGLLSGMSRQEIKLRSIQLAERLGIAGALNRPLKTYSKGMLQRMGFLVAIQHNPELVILDEPLSGLDPIGRKDLKDIIGSLSREGKTIFFSTHIVSDVEEICQNLVFLKSGKLVYTGEVKLLLEKNPSRVCRLTTRFAKIPNFNTPVIEIQQNLSTVVIKVEVIHREKLLAEILSEGGQILEVSSEGARLEQIVYGATQ